MNTKYKKMLKQKLIKDIQKRYYITYDIDIPFNFNFKKGENPNYITEKINKFEKTVEPIYWFHTYNRKYIMKSVLELNIKHNLKFDKTYVNSLYEFYRNDINKIPFLPSLIEETDDFFIFEYFKGDVLDTLSEKNNSIITTYKKYMKLNYPFFNLSNVFTNNWIISNDKLYYINLKSFYKQYLNEVSIISPDDKKTIITSTKSKIKDCFEI